MDTAMLTRVMRDRVQQLTESVGDQQLLIRWVIADADELTDSQSDILIGRLREGGLADELLQLLRSEFGTQSPGAWSTEMDVLSPTVLPSGWYEEETILGDLLRVVKLAQEQPESRLAHSVLPKDAKISEEIAAALEIASPEERLVILRQVAALSVDLLRGDKVMSTDFVMPASVGSKSISPVG